VSCHRDARKEEKGRQSKSERAQGTDWIPAAGFALPIRAVSPTPRASAPVRGGVALLGYFCAVRGGAGKQLCSAQRASCHGSRQCAALHRNRTDSCDRERRAEPVRSPFAKLFLSVLQGSCRVGRGDEPNRAYFFGSTNSTGPKLGYTEGGEWSLTDT